MWNRTIQLIIVNIVLSCAAKPLMAHGVGGVLRITDHQIGPYTVNVWTTPNILRPGAVHVETAVWRGRGLVIDCAVQVTLTPKSSAGSTLTSVAGAATVDNDFRHEAAFQIERTGSYEVEVLVLDAIGRGGQVSTEIEIVPVALWFQGLIYGLLGASGLLGLFLLRLGLGILYRQYATGA